MVSRSRTVEVVVYDFLSSRVSDWCHVYMEVEYTILIYVLLEVSVLGNLIVLILSTINCEYK